MFTISNDPYWAMSFLFTPFTSDDVLLTSNDHIHPSTDVWWRRWERLSTTMSGIGPWIRSIHLNVLSSSSTEMLRCTYSTSYLTCYSECFKNYSTSLFSKSVSWHLRKSLLIAVHKHLNWSPMKYTDTSIFMTSSRRWPTNETEKELEPLLWMRIWVFQKSIDQTVSSSLVPMLKKMMMHFIQRTSRDFKQR